MARALMRDVWIARRPAAALAMVLAAGLFGQAPARDAAFPPAWTTPAAFVGSQAPAAGQAFMTAHGPAFVTGQLGSMETTTLPGSSEQGLLMNNNNGTSTLIVPGGLPQTVATPR
ncbi:MAG TPA: hypothetical protein VME47_20160 [Acetobacteraceae bacterium]|nr:hypothetical protein [Acetobacteraceae bacterium]